MSVEVIKEQIFQFLSSDEPEVMAIKGEWGVGKTFSWKKFLKDASSENRISLERYSYVSLFGINSLEAFKYSIFENVIKREIIGTEASIDTFKNNTASLIESFGRQSFNFLKGAPIVKSFSPAIETISFLSLNSTLICIDDLERKGKGLEIKDVLGLVSLLKEQKKCKVVLLLNDGEDGLEDYEKYREKVIDIELAFAPDPQECSEIAYSINTPNQSRLRELTSSLGIRNIRILKKIERLITLSLPLTEGFEPEISDQVIHSLVLYAWSYFCSNSNEDIPTLEFITSKGYTLLGIGDEEVSEQHKKWQTALQAYGYQLTDELDLLLAEAVKTGYFVEEDFKEKASHKNQEIIASKSQGSFSEAWRLYHDTFNDNGDEVINGLYESFKANCKYITPSNLNGTVSLFRELGEDDKATEIIDIYIESRKDETELFNMKENNVFGDIRDPEVIDKFNNVYNQSVTTETAKQVLDRIAGQNGWNQSDEVVLANTTIDEYYNLFKSETGRHLSSFVTTCLKFGQFGNASDQQKEIANRATEALLRIASESEINKRRVKKFGVDVEDA
ncbi:MULTISPECIES: P-loop NTPase fold protein [Shewanella]|uniref:P-loop NTPase fold protein n=1 Tax=Shewanella TaxID=22 RepID=UPI0030055C78